MADHASPSTPSPVVERSGHDAPRVLPSRAPHSNNLGHARDTRPDSAASMADSEAGRLVLSIGDRLKQPRLRGRTRDDRTVFAID